MSAMETSPVPHALRLPRARPGVVSPSVLPNPRTPARSDLAAACAALWLLRRGVPRRSKPRASRLSVAARRRELALSFLPGPAFAETEADLEASVAAGADREAGKVRRLLEDPEVKLIRQLQQRAQLLDGRTFRPLQLPSLLQKGSPLYDADVVCVGEIHDSEADHAMQRLLIDALTYALFLELRSSEGVDPSAPRGRTPQNLSAQKLAVGVEYFSRQQQPTLDGLVFDKSPDGPGSSPSKFRRSKWQACDWDRVWAYDWNLYAPLFRFCQLNLNRIVGLNLPLEAVLTVSRGGLDSAPEWLRSQLPPLDLEQLKHRRRFEDMLRMPLEKAVQRMSLPTSSWSPKEELNNMYQAQVLWDEFMANTALRYVSDVGGRLVVLAGANHVWRDAIPDRFEAQARRGGTARRATTIVPWRGSGLPPAGAADYLWQMDGPGGGDELAAELRAQRERLKGKSRVFPAGYI
ncbi:unnamed protein product [Effrenium voratum]|uniref:Haem-binding uptake Tiki superfamily ChaN domain-containing protein n=1 Tax=Effrenium voratum TaxID=2562239 RepID=A0AA36MLP0_9DINO|nr:unnamed protein product [Effrenium voratum]